MSEASVAAPGTIRPDVFYLEENGQSILPYVPASYLRVNSSKILDGLFIGNKDSSIDFEFMTANKITHIVNCVGHLMPNTMMKFGMQYLTFRWIDSKSTIMFDDEGRTLSRLVQFMQAALDKHHGVLVHSVHGKSRSCCVVAAFLMCQFNWSLQKALEFIQFKRSEINPKPYYLRQLRKMEVLHTLGGSGGANAQADADMRWLVECRSHDELIARNTFLNGHYIKSETETGSDFTVYNEDGPAAAVTDGANPDALICKPGTRLSWLDDAQLIRPGGMEYNCTNSPRQRPYPLTGILKKPTLAGGVPSTEQSAVSPIRLVRTAWNDGEPTAASIQSPVPTEIVEPATKEHHPRPLSAQLERVADLHAEQMYAPYTDYQWYNPASGTLGRPVASNSLASWGFAQPKKVRKARPSSSSGLSSSLSTAGTVSSIAKMNRGLKFSSADASRQQWTSPTLPKPRRTKLSARPASAPSSTDAFVRNDQKWMSVKFGRMGISAKTKAPFSGLGLSGNRLLSTGKQDAPKPSSSYH